MGICCTNHKQSVSTPKSIPTQINSQTSLSTKQSQKKNLEDELGMGTIRKTYEFHEIIGHGSFGKILKAKNKSDGHIVSVKLLNKAELSNSYQRVMGEVRILRMLDHPNIIKYYETYEDQKYVYIVMEYCSGGDLLEKILGSQSKNTPNGPAIMEPKPVDWICEKEVIQIMRKLFSGINHCHFHKIIHRDIKLENVMYSTKDKKSPLKLIDFGFSKHWQLNSEVELETMVGTPVYVAPEVLDENYGQECDIWSLGVLMFFLLFARYPFSGDNVAQLFDQIKSGAIDMETEGSSVSPLAKDLLKKIFVVNPKERISAEDALRHPWFIKKNGGKTSKINPEMLRKLHNYKASTKFQKAVMNILVKRLDEEQILELREAFLKMDKDHRGLISIESLQEAITEQGFHLTANEISEIIQSVAFVGNNMINYSEFLSATINSKKFLTQERLWSLFQYFDQDNTGKISIANLEEALKNEGRELEKQELEEIMKEHDLKHDGELCFNEFKIMMKKMMDNEETNDSFTITPKRRLSSRDNVNQLNLDKLPRKFSEATKATSSMTLPHLKNKLANQV